MDDVPLASVIICTRDRCASLARTLETLVKAANGVTDAWELLVVDNGSIDNTSATAASFADRLPIRYVYEKKPGLSNARNAGVRDSRGRYILWTDDDVKVDEGWLRAWFHAFRSYPDVAIFGGRSEPFYEEPQQQWFIANQKELESLLAIRDNAEWETISPARLPFGLNYAIRGSEQRRVPYDPELGVAPGRRRGGEETAVMEQLLAEGHTGRWVWDATVYHIIPTERQSEAYIRRYYTCQGYDYPLLRKEYEGRKIARFLRTLIVWAGASLSYPIKKRRSRGASVPTLITAAKAEGSLRSLIGMKEG